MGWLGDILGAALPIAGGAFLGPLGAVGGSLLGGAINSGGGTSMGGGFDLSMLAPYLSGTATAQRIPGQTQPGSYTPPEGGYGTYNYIPTGAGQLDPALINQILSSMGGNNPALTTGQGANGALFNQATANPFTDALTNASGNAGAMSGGNATTQQNWGAGLGGAGTNMNDMFMNLMGRAGTNPFISSMISGGQDAGQRFQNAGTWLSDYTAGGIQNLANPYYGQQMQGATGAGNMLGASGADTFNKGAAFSGTAAAGLPAISSILNTAFDPQTAQYNKAATQNQDQISSFLARSGLTNSGAGAGIANDATTNFNLGWQNQQLGRQATGLGAYTNALTGAGGNLGTGANLQATGAGNVAAGAGLPANTLNQQTGSRFDLSSKGSGALGAAEGLNLAGTQIPYQAYDTSTNDYAKYLGQYANALPSIGGALSGGSTLLNQGVNSALGAGAIPYNATQTMNTNNQNALTNFLGNQTSIGNQTNQSSQQLMDYLRLVMGGSANAANAATGAQAGTNTSNANAAAAMNPLVTGGLNSLSSLISKLFSGGSSPTIPGFSGAYNTPSYTGGTYTPYTTMPSIGSQVFA